MKNEYLERFRRSLAAMMQWFRSEGLRAAIIGGVAAGIRGRPRLTDDIDAVVFETAAESLLESGAAFGFVPRISNALEFSRSTRVLLLRHEPANVDVDLSLGALPFEDELIERSSWIDIGNRLKIHVASAEDLIIMKAIARRSRDIADIEYIIDANAELDIDRIRYWIREFSAVLEMPEIHEDLEKLLKRRKR